MKKLYMVDADRRFVQHFENLIFTGSDEYKMLGHNFKANDFLIKIKERPDLLGKIDLLLVNPKLNDLNGLELIKKVQGYRKDINVCVIVNENIKAFYENDIAELGIDNVIIYPNEDMYYLESLQKAFEVNLRGGQESNNYEKVNESDIFSELNSSSFLSQFDFDKLGDDLINNDIIQSTPANNSSQEFSRPSFEEPKQDFPGPSFEEPKQEFPGPSFETPNFGGFSPPSNIGDSIHPAEMDNVYGGYIEQPPYVKPNFGNQLEEVDTNSGFRSSLKESANDLGYSNSLDLSAFGVKERSYNNEPNVNNYKENSFGKEDASADCSKEANNSQHNFVGDNEPNNKRNDYFSGYNPTNAPQQSAEQPYNFYDENFGSNSNKEQIGNQVNDGYLNSFNNKNQNLSNNYERDNQNFGGAELPYGQTSNREVGYNQNGHVSNGYNNQLDRPYDEISKYRTSANPPPNNGNTSHYTEEKGKSSFGGFDFSDKDAYPKDFNNKSPYDNGLDSYGNSENGNGNGVYNYGYEAPTQKSDDIIKDMYNNSGVENLNYNPVHNGGNHQTNISHQQTNRATYNEVPDFAKQVVAFYSTKGGVGKTTLLVNSTIKLAAYSRNKRICVVDFDVTSANVHTHLGILDSPYDLSVISNFESDIDSFSISRIVTPYRVKDKNGNTVEFDVIVGFKEMVMRQRFTEQEVHKILCILEEMYDIVIVDTHPVYTDSTISTVLKKATKIIYVAEQELPALTGAKDFIETSAKYDIPREKVFLVLNRYNPSTSVISKNRVEKTLEKTVMVTVPVDMNSVRESVNTNSPIAVSNPDGELSKAYTDIARIINKNLVVPEQNKGFFGRFKK